MSDAIEGTVYGDTVRVTSAEAESLFSNPEWGEPDHPNTQRGLDQQQSAAPAEPNSEEATAESTEPQETEQPNEPKSTPSEIENKLSPDQVEVNGEVYTVDQIKEFIDDSKNKDEWQRKNTQRSQDLAEQRKAIRAESEQWKSLRQDEELMDTVKDFVDDDHPLFKEESEEPELTESQDTEPSDQKVEALEAEVIQMKAERQVEQEVATLTSQHPELAEEPKVLDQVLEVAVKQNLMDLEAAYKIVAFDAAEDSSLKKALAKVEKANELKSIPETKGVTRAERTASTKKPANYDEAREIAFNEYNLYE